MIDLRSDTVTRPTPEMFEVMRQAALGDDVLGDDPTVQQLEELAAEKMGMEAALFVPSGTMGNQIALAVHTRPGDAVLFEEEAHMLMYEGGAPGVIAGIVARGVPSVRGVMLPGEIEKRILKKTYHTPGTVLLCVENTHNRAGGAVVPLEMHQAYRRLADVAGLRIHLDGARVFNAAVALGVDVRQITEQVDSVNFCLSKGLRSPVGSLLCGPATFIEESRYWRKRLGGGMRQAGLLAACGIVSLTHYVDRLAEDHAQTQELARLLLDVPGIEVDMGEIQTNFVMVETRAKADLWAQQLKDAGVLCLPFGEHRLRLVLHADIAKKDLAVVVDAFQLVSKDMSVGCDF